MPQKIGDLDYYPVSFKSDGSVAQRSLVDALLAAVADEPVKDLFVVSHGWRNDAGDAQGIYQALFGNVSDQLRSRGRQGEKVLVAGVFWPSEPWYRGLETIPGGKAASVGDEDDRRLLEHELKKLRELVADDSAAAGCVDTAKSRLSTVNTAAGLTAFVADLRNAVTKTPAQTDDDAADLLVKAPAQAVVDAIGAPGPNPDFAVTRGGAADVGVLPPMPPGAGGAADFGLSSIFSKLANLVEKLSYYEMKERAGRVGKGLAGVLDLCQGRNGGLRIHLVGHSFGARVVTAAAMKTKTAPASLALLQAAFSHNAFAIDYDGKGAKGFFRHVVSKPCVSGPIVVTHTKNDKAVGLAYPAASRLLNQQAAGFGEADDRFGALGRNGAQHTPEASSVVGGLKEVGSPYSLENGRLYNINGDAFIKRADGGDAHGEVTGPEIAHLVLSAARF